MRVVLCAAVLVLVAGCGVPSEPSKQAEAIASISSEGSLLAHEVAEGDSTGPFTRAHTGALLDKLATLRPEVRSDVLRRLILDADRALEGLRDAPDDRANAARVERTLDKVSKVAEEHAG